MKRDVESSPVARMRRGRWGALLTLVWWLSVGVQAHDEPAGSDAAAEMAAAASRFVASLDADQRSRAVAPFDGAERLDWHFFPKDRRGVAFKEMTGAQRALAYGLLGSGLSSRGYLKATSIMALEQVLRDLEGGSGATRDPELYFVAVFGTPEARGTWGWRVEGHHLSLNFTLADGRVAAQTPSFMGTNPATVRSGALQGTRVLGREEDLARELVRSLDPDQRRLAVFSETAPSDIITMPGKAARPLEPAGLAASRLNDEQQRLLWALLVEYLERHRPELAEAELAQLKAGGFKTVHFAWAGSVEPGQGHYYRVQSARFILEYDNTQNNANHVHTVWRDFTNDFGEDLLRRHYQEQPHGR